MLQQTLELGQTLNESHLQAEALMELGRLRVAEERPDLARQLLTEAIALARRIAARSVLAEACEALSQVAEATGDVTTALAMYKEFHAVRESELADSRKHAALAAQLGLDFQEASRRAAEYRERAEALAADHAALTTRARALAEVSEQDPLTGLLNRRGLETRIGSLLIAGDAQNAPLTMALIDIDIFKRINDSHSHAVGDAVLKQVAGVIRAHCRQNDLPVRYGGDEFLLVLADANLSTGAKVLQRLKVANDSWPWQDLSPGLAVTLSIGAAERAPGASITAAIEAADAALYEAKNAGRNQIATRGSESAAAAVFGPTEPR